jgi:hypothetical protein
LHAADVDRTVVVIGAQPGVGASTVALALADSWAVRCTEPLVRLVDLAELHESGLLGAADELGREADGWLLSHRGHLRLERPSGEHLERAVREVPGSRVVVDISMPVEHATLNEGPLRSLLGASSVVVACRATVPGMRHVERVLTALPGTPYVVASGVRRWPGAAVAAAGPLTRAAHADGRCHCLPADRRLAVEGLDDRPLPRSVLSAAAGLLDAIAPNEPAHSERPKKGFLSWR